MTPSNAAVCISGSITPGASARSRSSAGVFPRPLQALAVQVADAVARMRDSDVQKPPGIAEAIDWLRALSVLGVEQLDAAAIDRTLGAVLKYNEDQDVVRTSGLAALVGGDG